MAHENDLLVTATSCNSSEDSKIVLDNNEEECFSPEAMDGHALPTSNGDATTTIPQQLAAENKDMDSSSDEEYLISSRPQRKIKPVVLFCELEAGSQTGRQIASKKKRKPNATLVGANIFGKPCAVCCKIFKTGEVLECCKYVLNDFFFENSRLIYSLPQVQAPYACELYFFKIHYLQD